MPETNSLRRLEAELRTTCEANTNDYENQAEKIQKIVFVKKKLQQKSKISGTKLPGRIEPLPKALGLL